MFSVDMKEINSMTKDMTKANNKDTKPLLFLSLWYPLF